MWKNQSLSKALSVLALSTTAAAPSDSCEALPAVTKLPSPLTGCKDDRPARVVSARLHSSLSTT